jgi:hypothetical protein
MYSRSRPAPACVKPLPLREPRSLF